MLNSLWFEIQGQSITKMSFSPIEGGVKLNILDISDLLPDRSIRLGSDWLSIAPAPHKAEIPETSVDYQEPGSG